jgi:hypothetical protein
MFFKSRNTGQKSSSLPSMSVIGSAQPDILKLKVYVKILFYFSNFILLLLSEME